MQSDQTYNETRHPLNELHIRGLLPHRVFSQEELGTPGETEEGDCVLAHKIRAVHNGWFFKKSGDMVAIEIRRNVSYNTDLTETKVEE